MTSAAVRMVEQAEAFLDCLTPAQRAAATFPMADAEERTDWHYVPRPRSGVHLAELVGGQRLAAMRLVATGLSDSGYASVATVVALEDVLDHLEERTRGRHSGDYALSIFGDPTDAAEPWAWRFEGHHLSLHHTVRDGAVSSGPFFLGAHPARVEAMGLAVAQPLAAEEAFAREVLASFDRVEWRLALIDSEAPSDIVTRASVRVPDWLEPSGVSGSQLGIDGAVALGRLVEVYLRRFAPDVAARWRREAAEGDVHFAWAGSPEPGAPHYYRVQGPSFLVEYDNSQDDANHVHTVWRSRVGDFGIDLLADHHRLAHSVPDVDLTAPPPLRTGPTPIADYRGLAPGV